MLRRALCCLIVSWVLSAGNPSARCFAQAPAVQSGSAHQSAGGIGARVRHLLLIDWLSNQFLGLALSGALTAKLHGITHVTVKSNDIADAWRGDFQSLKIVCHGGKYKGLTLGAFQLESQRPVAFAYRKARGRVRGLQAPLLVSIQGDMAVNDLSHIFKSKTVTSNLHFLKFDLPGLGEQHLQVRDPLVDIDGDRIDLRCNLITANAAPSTAVKVHIKAHPQLDRERYVRLTNMQVQSDDISDPVHFGPFLETLFNPLIDFGHFDRFSHCFRLSALHIQDGVVHYDGRLWLVPRAQEKTGYSAAFLMAHPEIDPTKGAGK
jgi:hypothetical protein